MGYKDAEALMTFYNNTPNDTLGIFWFPIDEKNQYFQGKWIFNQAGKEVVMRKSHVGGSDMNLNLEERNIKYKELLILSYFQSHYKKYNLDELVRIMGMTYSEMDEFIQHLLNLNQLKIYDNYLVISKSGEQLLDENHMRNFFR